jgi:heptosyltransferase III
MSAEAPRVLLIRRRYLGDIVLLGGVLRNLRLHWPDARLNVLTEPAYTGVLALNPDLATPPGNPPDARSLPRSLREWPGFVRWLRSARFTHVLDFDNTDRTAIVARFTGAAVRAAYHRELIPFRYRRFYTHAANVTNAFYDAHSILDTYLALPAAIGVPIVSREVRLVPPADAMTAAARLLGTRAGAHESAVRPPRILVHPGSRSAYRLWPADRFARVCDRLQDELDAQVFLAAGPGEQALVDEIRQRAHTHVVGLMPLTDVGTLAALAAQVEVVLCHDSGPMHVAAAVGTPVVALFGSQNATIWRPLGEHHTVLQTPLPCTCLGADAPGPCVRDDSYRSYCVRKLTEEQVFTALAARL